MVYSVKATELFSVYDCPVSLFHLLDVFFLTDHEDYNPVMLKG